MAALGHEWPTSPRATNGRFGSTPATRSRSCQQPESALSRHWRRLSKIDQSFVQAVPPDPEGIVLGAVINMAKNLNHRVIAEGVETPVQLASLRDLQCGEGQGYLFNRPGDADAFADLLEAGISEEIAFH
jgi:EAL domain-containing protein (putative c-di-GMP-specific phosphodiesterase class I)